MKGLFKDFRNFIMTGNVIDFAVAVLMAGAVGMVVNGFVNDIMMPVVGFFTGGVDFSDMAFVLSEAVRDTDGSVQSPEIAIRYGAWINSLINLVIVGFILFVIVKGYGKLRAQKEQEPTSKKGPTQVELLTEIRDLLKK